MTWPIITGREPVRVADLGDAREVVEFMLRPGLEARLTVAPTALAGGFTYEVILRRFVSEVEVVEQVPQRHIVGAGQKGDDDGHTIVRGLN